MQRYRQNPLVTETSVDDDLFLVEPEGKEIYHLDATASGLWRALAEPSSLDELTDVFNQAFTDSDPEQIERDVAQALDTFLKQGLATPC